MKEYTLQLSEDEFNMLKELINEDTQHIVKEYKSELNHLLDRVEIDWREKLLTTIDVAVEVGYFDDIDGDTALDRVINIIKSL